MITALQQSKLEEKIRKYFTFNSDTTKIVNSKKGYAQGLIHKLVLECTDKYPTAELSEHSLNIKFGQGIEYILNDYAIYFDLHPGYTIRGIGITPEEFKNYPVLSKRPRIISRVSKKALINATEEIFDFTKNKPLTLAVLNENRARLVSKSEFDRDISTYEIDLVIKNRTQGLSLFELKTGANLDSKKTISTIKENLIMPYLASEDFTNVYLGVLSPAKDFYKHPINRKYLDRSLIVSENQLISLLFELEPDHNLTDKNIIDTAVDHIKQEINNYFRKN